MPPTTGSWRAAMTEEVPLLYLNRCEGGCTFNPGPDDAQNNISSIVRWRNSRLPEFSHDEDTWDEMVRCVQKLYEPFHIEVTDQDPGNIPHFESIVAGAPSDIGLMSEIGGIAPGGCGVRPNSINFTFSDVVGQPLLEQGVTAAENICRVVGQESAHAFGLDHQLTCDDPMTYLGYCAPYAFQRVDAPCGERTERQCFCGPNFQNSYLHLLNTFGARPEPLTFGPALKLLSPRDGEEVEPNFWIIAEARDDDQLDRVEFYLDGQQISVSQDLPPQSTQSSGGLELGPHTIRVVAFDNEGNENSRTIDITLIEAEDPPDIGVRDIASAPPPLRYDGGYTFPDAGTEMVPIPVDSGGCVCASPSEGTGVWWLLFAPLLLGLRRRRLLVVAGMVGLLGCEDSGGLSTVFPKLELNPEVDTPLVFAPIVLPEESAPPIVIEARNNGQVPLNLLDAQIVSEGPTPFRVSSFTKSIGPGAAGEIFLRFEPQYPDQFSAELVVQSNDPDRREVRFQVSGGATEPCVIGAWPTYLGFKIGEVKTVSIRALSTADCKIVRLFTDRDLFRILNEPELPLTIPAGESLELEIEHYELTVRPGRPIRELRVKQEDGQEVLVTLEGQAPLWNCVDVYPPNLDFENTGLGVEGRGRAIVTNRCPEEGVIKSVRIGRGFYFYKLDMPDEEFPITLPPFGQVSVWVKYLPFSDRGDLGRLSVNTNDAVSPRIDIRMRGRALHPKLRTLSALDFGRVPVVAGQRCRSEERILPIHSVGNSPLIIESFTTTGDHADAFTVTSVTVDRVPVPLGQAIVVPPGSRAEFRMRFSPDVAEDHRARMVFKDNTFELSTELELLGSAQDGLTSVDQYTQPQGPKVDFLWAVDDSRSMVTEQNTLAAAIPALLTATSTANLDYQMMATRTDVTTPPVGWLEQCRGHPLVITPGYDEREIALECLLRIGLSGEGRQGGLGAVLQSVLRLTDPRAIPNPGFGVLRPDAQLNLVVVTNEEDSSSETIESVVELLRAVKGPAFADRVKLHAIVGPTDTFCDVSRPWVQPGFRYRRVTRDLGGEMYNVCESDWTSHVQALAQAEPYDRYATSSAVAPGTLTVTVDGQPVVEDAVSGFVFDASRGMVQLNSAVLPTPGSQVRLEYQAACEP